MADDVDITRSSRRCKILAVGTSHLSWWYFSRLKIEKQCLLDAKIKNNGLQERQDLIVSETPSFEHFFVTIPEIEFKYERCLYKSAAASHVSSFKGLRYSLVLSLIFIFFQSRQLWYQSLLLFKSDQRTIYHSVIQIFLFRWHQKVFQIFSKSFWLNDSLNIDLWCNFLY